MYQCVWGGQNAVNSTVKHGGHQSGRSAAETAQVHTADRPSATRATVPPTYLRLQTERRISDKHPFLISLMVSQCGRYSPCLFSY